MMPNLRQNREKAPDTEKLTLNLGHVDVGRIDLMVQEGFYSNRSDFIRTAIRRQLDLHADTLQRSIARQTLELGLRDVSAADLADLQAEGRMLHLRVVGLVRIAADVTPDLARATIGSLTILGALQAPGPVKAALADRID